MTHDEVVAEVQEAIDNVCAGDPWLREHRPAVSVYQAGGPFEQELDHPFVKTFLSSFETVTGRPAEIKGLPGGCDSRTWKNIAGCPTLHFGPGDSARSHSVDEALEVEDFLRCILIYAQLILDWCNR